MSCSNPLRLYKKINRFTGEISDQCFFFNGEIEDLDDDFVLSYLVPCGQCSDCRADQAHAWADRLVLESLFQGRSRSWFITLTYDEDHLPDRDSMFVDRRTFEPVRSGALCMDHVSVWIKRIRSRLNQPGIRYFACGEYGETTSRPHYHVILFASLGDLQKNRPDGTVLPNSVWFSPTIEEAWGFGGTSVAEANEYSMSYVSGYVQKKLRGLHEAQYQDLCRVMDLPPQPRESSRMSRRPGIGVPWIREHGELCKAGKVAVPTQEGARWITLPRVADAHLDPDVVNMYKDRRKIASLAVRDRKRVLLDGKRTLAEELRLDSEVRAKDPRRHKRSQTL